MPAFAAIIPAAGLSSRMGEFKPLLPLGSGTVLSRCVELFQANGISRILVVTGNNGSETARTAQAIGAAPVHNPDYTQGMFSSLLTGIRALPEDADAFLVLPVDIPLLRPETIRRLLDKFSATAPGILYPRFAGERGHPPVINRKLVPKILAHDGAGGLRTVLERLESEAYDLDVADSGTIHDLDHPSDYAEACERVGTQYPTAQECQQLWDIYSLPLDIRDHCSTVAHVAKAICRQLNRSSSSHNQLNTDLSFGASLVHDLGKGTRNHESEGAQRLRVHGFHAAAEIAELHSDLTLVPEAPITETEIVFLADKLVLQDSFATLERRYRDRLERFGHDPWVRRAILERLHRATVVRDRFDSELGMSVQLLAQRALA